MAAVNLDLIQVVKMICPSAEELSVIVNNIRCTQCGLLFHNESRLRLHDLKVHQRKNLNKIVKEFVRYHCPVSSCIYSPMSKRYFTTMKYLKQHYLKVHAAKMYSCTQCEKSFSTEAAKAAHFRICGLAFNCSCLKTFTTYEALLTHAKRQSHLVDEKYKNLLKRGSQKILPAKHLISIAPPTKKFPISILPYQKKIVNTIQESILENTRDMSTQTDDLKKLKRLPSPSKSNNKKRESRQTQTNLLSKEKRCRKTVETQTSPTVRESNKRLSISMRRKQQQQQLQQELTNKDSGLSNTFPSDNLQIFPTSPLQLHYDVQIEDFWGERNNSRTHTTTSEKDPLDVFNDSVTQTDLIPFYDHEDGMQLSYKNNGSSLTSLPYTKNYFSPTNLRTSCSDPMLTEETYNNHFSSIETQTERPYLQSVFDSIKTISRTFALSSTSETQTTEHFDDMEHLLYNNTYTQTCNDIFSSELGLSDIQTQTAWPELEDTTIESSNSQTPNNNDNKHNNYDENDNDNGGGDDDKSNISINACRSWLSTHQTNHTETQTDLLSIFDEFQ